MPAPSVYITGTDTGIGKTRVSTAWLHGLRARGLAAVGMKPVASGCEAGPDGWRNEDALALQAASACRAAYDDINPYALPLPLAPELAARAAGVDIRLDRIVAAHARLGAQADVVVVEGVGGWAAPLSDSLMQVDLARALGLPVVLVVGWVGNAIDPDMACREEHRTMLQSRIEAPCLGWLPHEPLADGATQSRYLSLPDWTAS